MLTVIGAMAAVVFAHGMWESNMNACAATYGGSGSIEWSWREVGFVCHGSDGRSYDNGLGVVPTAAIGGVVLATIGFFLRRAVRKHPTSAFVRVGRKTWRVALIPIVFALLYMAAGVMAFDSRFFSIALVTVALANLAVAVHVALRWRPVEDRAAA